MLVPHRKGVVNHLRIAEEKCRDLTWDHEPGRRTVNDRHTVRPIRIQNARAIKGGLGTRVRILPRINISPTTRTSVAFSEILAGMVATATIPIAFVERITLGRNPRRNRVPCAPHRHPHLLDLVINIVRRRLAIRIVRVVNHELVGFPPPHLPNRLSKARHVIMGLQDPGNPAGEVIVPMAKGLSIPNRQRPPGGRKRCQEDQGRE